MALCEHLGAGSPAVCGRQGGSTLLQRFPTQINSPGGGEKHIRPHSRQSRGGGQWYRIEWIFLNIREVPVTAPCVGFCSIRELEQHFAIY